MNRIVLIKEGEYRPSLFADFVETVNRPEAEQVGFYTRHDYTFRLTRNRSTLEPTFPIALAHYNVDVACQIQDPKLFRPIDTESIFRALNKYDYVMFGAITPSHIVQDQQLFGEAMYIARNEDNKLVNALTDEVLQPDTDKVTFITTFFGVVRMKGLPVYVIILNSSLARVTDGFDYHHEPSDTLYSLVTDHDGTIKDTVFAPFITGVREFGSVLYAEDAGGISFNFFTHPSVLRNMDTNSIFADCDYTIDTNLGYFMDGSTIHVSRPYPITSIAYYFSITFHCGTFFEIASTIEQPTFNYVVIFP